MRREWKTVAVAAIVFVLICMAIVLYAPEWGLTPTETASSVDLPEEPLNINEASAEQLERLPGLSRKTAEAIVSWRELYGGFLSLEELEEIDGIGESLLASLRPYLVCTAPSGVE